MLPFLAIVAQAAERLKDAPVGRHHGPRVAVSPEVFRGIEAEGGGGSEGADLSPFIEGAVGLARVLEYCHAEAVGHIDDLVHPAGVAVKVDGDAHLHAPLRFEHFFEGMGVHGVGLRVYIAENRHHAVNGEGHDGGDIRVRGGDDLVARFQPERQPADADRVGA